MNTKQPTWELTYSDDYDELTGNILKVTPDFMNALQQHPSIIIEGGEDEDFLFSVENNTYKLRDIFLPSTMLLTKELIQTDRPRDVAYVNLQTAHYLKLEAHDIEYHTIYTELMQQSVGRELLEESHSLVKLAFAAGISSKAICSRYRITPLQLEQLLKLAPAMVVHSKDVANIEEPLVMIWSNEAILSIMRQLLPFLMQKGLSGEWFAYDQVAPLGLVKHQKIMHLLAKVFEMEVEGNGFVESLSEPMEMEQAPPLRFKLKLESIIRFVLLEHLIAKNEYLMKEMDPSLWNLVVTYLPVGLPDFDEAKAKNALQDLLGSYFLTVPKQGITFRIAYDPLLINSTIKDRLDFLREFKKKFTLGQLKGLFGKMAKEVDLGGVLMKHFRKCGQEYELKLIIPK